MKGLFRAFRRLLPDRVDLHVYGGAAILVWGVWMVSRPGGPIAAGALLFGLGIMLHHQRGGS